MKRSLGILLLLGVGSGAGWMVFKRSRSYDTITIADSAGPATARLYLTGNRWGGCFCLFATVQDSIQLDNVTSGPSQVAWFASGHGVQFDPNVLWDPSPLESKPYVLPDSRSLPIKAWILYSRWKVKAVEKAVEFLQTPFEGVKPTGLRIDARGIVEIKEPDTATVDCDATVEKLKMRGQFDTTAVNVYFAESFKKGEYYWDAAGMSCPDGRVNFVLANAGWTVAAHEIGHALLGADHWEAGEVSVDNVMLGDQHPNRTHLSIGQIIRMNVDQHSVLNAIESHPGLDCTRQCPSVALDDGPSGCQIPMPSLRVQAAPSVTALYLAWRDCIECNAGELSALVDRADEAMVQQLVEALNGAPLQLAGDDPESMYKQNDLARQQRRALLALVMLGGRGTVRARTAANTAYENRNRYRDDVKSALERAHAFIIANQ